MMRLIVVEGGQRRAFKVSPGRLTIGRGEKAQLRLESAKVGELHAELVLSQSGGTLRCFHGATPVRKDGLAYEEVQLAFGESIELGDATLSLADEEPEALPPAVVETAEPGPPKGAHSKPRRSRRKAARAEADPEGGEPHKKPRKKKSLAWLWLVGCCIATLILAWKLIGPGADEVGVSVARSAVEKRLNQAAEHANAGRFEQAEAELAFIPKEGLEPDLRARLAQTRTAIRAHRGQSPEALQQLAAAQFLQNKLKRYYETALVGAPDRARVRVFLKRCEEFQRRWPNHPESSWVERHADRFSGAVDPGAPPLWSDLEFEIELLAGARSDPRDYVQAMALIDDFIARGAREDHGRAQALRASLDEQRVRTCDELLQRAGKLLASGQSAEGVGALVTLSVFMGEPNMQRDAVARLLRVEEIEKLLRGYREAYPDLFARLIAIPEVAAFGAQHGLK